MTKIYESPDGGSSVYERDTKTGKRKCISKPNRPDYHILDHEWQEITELAESGNKALQNSLKELKILYNLVRDPSELNEWWNE